METAEKTTTKYELLVQQLNILIQDLILRSENCLPSERELCKRFGVSRITVRRALAELETSGTIYRVHGKGAFISNEKYSAQLPSLTSLTEDMRGKNISCCSRILALETVPASARVSRNLAIEENSAVIMLKRLRLAGGKPLAIETCYLPPAIGNVVAQHIADNISLYSIFREKCGVSPVYADQNLEIGLLQPWEQSLLGDNAPVYAMFTTRLAYDSNDTPLEYVEGKYRGDRYSYHITLTSEHPHGWNQP